MHGGFQLLGCIEPDAVRRHSFQNHWGVPQAFANWTEADASDERWDVISICSPTSSHHADVMNALRAQPRLIFCEKPLAPTIAQAEEIVSSCAQSNVMLVVNHTRRWAPDVIEFGAQLTNGQHGVPRAINATYNKGILNNGSHMLDILSFWFGPLNLLTSGVAMADFWDNDPSIPALLTTPTGLNININCSHAKDYSLFEIEIAMSKALIAMEDGGLAWRIRQPHASFEFQGYQTLDTGKRTAGRYLEAMTGAVTNIYDAITRHAPLRSTGETALKTQRLCEKIRTAAVFPLTTLV